MVVKVAPNLTKTCFIMSSATNIKILKDTKIGNPDFRHNYLDFASQLSQAVSYCVACVACWKAPGVSSVQNMAARNDENVSIVLNEKTMEIILDLLSSSSSSDDDEEFFNERRIIPKIENFLEVVHKCTDNEVSFYFNSVLLVKS